MSRAAAQSARRDTTAPQGPEALLRRHRLRCTPSRLRVLTLFATSDHHLSITEVADRLARTGPPVHLTMVYRSLESFIAVGLAHAVHGPGATRYGLTGEPHHHTVCQQCGHVAALANEHLIEAAGKIEELTGLRPDASGSLLVYGRCTRCCE